MAGAAAAALALLLLVACGALYYLQAPAGTERARRAVLSALEGRMEGSAEVGALDLDLVARELVLRGLSLHDPEGRLVAEIAEVRLRLGITALLRRRVLIKEALVRRPRLYLVSDGRGFNLARAVARKPAVPEEAEPRERPSRLSLELKHLSIEDGFASFAREGEERDLESSVEGLAGTGEASWSGPDMSLRARLSLAGRQRAPVEGELELSARFSMEGGAMEGELALRGPGVELDAAGVRPSGQEARVEVRSARLDPSAAAAFLERYPLQVPAHLSGTVDLRGDVVSASLDGAAGRSRVALRGMLDVKRLWSDGLTLAAREVDLSELTPRGPSTSLRLDLAARGGGRTLEALVGEVRLTVPPSRVRGEPLGPIQLSASADRGRFHLPALAAVLPGVSVELAGQGTLERISVEGKVRAEDLAKLSSMLERLGLRAVPAVAGRGNLDFKVNGPLRHPGISASGRFDELAAGNLSAGDLELNADVPDVTRPLTTEATLKAARVGVSERGFRRVLMQVGSEGREVRANVRFTPLLRGEGGAQREAGELSALVAGTRDEGSRGLLLRELVLSYPEATWRLRHPSHLTFRDGFSAEPLELTSGGQLLSLEGSVGHGMLDVAAEARRLDLGRLPSAFVDPELRLAGVLGARVRARGPSRRLAVDAEVELEGGRVREYDSLGLTLSGRLAGDRARGALRLSSGPGRLAARFDLPVRDLARLGREPLEAFLELEEQPIGAILEVAGRPERVTGTASASLAVGGTADNPAARLSIRTRNLVLELPNLPRLTLEAPSLDVAVEAGEGGRLRARADVEDRGTAGTVVVQTPFRLTDLWTRPPDLEALRSASYSVSASFRDLPLNLLELAGVPHLRGRASLRAELRGTLEDPALDAHLEGRGVARGEAAPTDISVDLVAGEREVAASVRARRGSLSLADVTVRAGGPLRALRALEALEGAPLRVEGTVGPISPADWLLPPASSGEGSSPMSSGQVAVRLRGGGTLANPRLDLLATIEQLRASGACVGRGTLRYGYSGGVSTFAAALTSSGQGRATASGTLGLDLSLPALRRGLDVGRAPLDAVLEANDLDLAVLGGTLPLVRAISGRLFASARVHGALGDLGQQGWVEWRDGALALDGYGDYRSIQLRAEAGADTFRLARLEARSGAGQMELTATATRGAGGLHVTGEGNLRRFPIVYKDQLYAALDARLQLQGDLSPDVVDFREISIPEARVELPEVRRKDLQEIDRPSDVVLVRHGKPVKRQKARPPQDGRAGAGYPGAVASAKGSRQYRFTFRAPRNVWLRSSDVNMEVGLSEGFRVEHARHQGGTRIFGNVRILRGRITALGRDLDVQRGSTIAFGGSARRPRVDVTATHVNRREQVTVFLNVTGEGKDLSFRPTSQPPLTESEIYTLLATGRRTLKRGSGASMGGGDAASILGSLAASQLRGTISENVPLDVVTIEAGGGGGLSGTRVEVGTYLSDKAYLGGEVRIGADPRRGENTYGFRFEYQLTPRLSFQTEYGDARSGSADLIWSREY